MNWLSAWFKAHNWSTKSILAAIGAGALIVGTSTQAQAFVMLTFKSHPEIGTWIVAAATIYLTLKSPHSPAGTVAASKAIMKNTATAPTAAEVDAATTK